MYFSRTDAKENRVFGGFGGLVGMAAFRWIGEEGERGRHNHSQLVAEKLLLLRV